MRIKALGGFEVHVGGVFADFGLLLLVHFLYGVFRTRILTHTVQIIFEV